jgi:hypothetical protein
VRSGAVGLFAIVTACSSSATTSTPTTSTAPRPARCAMPTPFGKNGAAPHEVHGKSAHGSVWGLALGPGHIPPDAGDELKIVWRMTGQGPLRVAFTGPDGKRHSLVFGPEPHRRASTYHRPGDEWGTGFRFATKGCWHIHLARRTTAGDMWIDVHRSLE